MSRGISVLIVLGFLACIITAGFILMGALPAVVFSVAFGGGFLLWLVTTYRTPVDPNKVIVPYLFAILLFIIHVYEEYLTDFEVAMTDITGFHVLERDFLTFAAFLAPCLWITGAILLLKKTHVGYYFLSAFFVPMTIAELAHFVFRHYTAMGSWVVGIFCLVCLPPCSQRLSPFLPIRKKSKNFRWPVYLY